MARLGIEIKELEGIGLVAQLGEALDVTVHGGRIAGDIDYFLGIPGSDHVGNLLIQPYSGWVDYDGVDFSYLGIPLLHRGREELRVLQVALGQGETELVDLDCSDIEPVFQVGAEGSYPAVEIHDAGSFREGDNVVDQLRQKYQVGLEEDFVAHGQASAVDGDPAGPVIVKHSVIRGDAAQLAVLKLPRIEPGWVFYQIVQCLVCNRAFRDCYAFV